MKLKPIELEYLLHCYYLEEKSPLQEVTVIKEFARRMAYEGILEKSFMGVNPELTKKGVAWIQLILDIDVPEIKIFKCLSCTREVDSTVNYCTACNTRNP